MGRLVILSCFLGSLSCTAIFETAPASDGDAAPPQPLDADLDADAQDDASGRRDGGVVMTDSIAISDALHDAVVFPDRDVITSVLNGDDLDIGSSHDDGAFVERTTVALRFEQLPIPQGAVVIDAQIQFTAQETQGGDLRVAISLENDITPADMTQNVPTLHSRSSDVVGMVEWNINEEWLINQSGPAQRTPSFGDQLQLLVNVPEWSPGNSIVVFLVNISGQTESRPVYSFDGTQLESQLPTLLLRYEEL